MKVDLVIPFFNEEKNLEILIPELNEVIPILKNDYRVIFVNDGSQDQSEKMIRDKIENISFVILTNDQNLGQTSAFQKHLITVQEILLLEWIQTCKTIQKILLSLMNC